MSLESFAEAPSQCDCIILTEIIEYTCTMQEHYIYSILFYHKPPQTHFLYLYMTEHPRKGSHILAS